VLEYYARGALPDSLGCLVDLLIASSSQGLAPSRNSAVQSQGVGDMLCHGRSWCNAQTYTNFEARLSKDLDIIQDLH
jgi:hypothetical protein